MPQHVRPIVLVDATRLTLVATTRALERIGRCVPLVHLLQPSLARPYLRDAVRVGRLPALVILRTPADDSAVLEIREWVRAQPEPLRAVPVLAIGDRLAGETDTLDRWIECAIRMLLERSDEWLRPTGVPR